MPDTSGKLPRTIPSEDCPEFGMRLPDGPKRHPRLQRAWTRCPHSRLLAPQARPCRFRRGECRGSEGDAPPLAEGVRVRHEPLDFGDGSTGELRGGAYTEAGLRGDHPHHPGASSRSEMAAGQTLDHLPRSPVWKKKRRRDGLMSVAAANPDVWAVGFLDECWWSRVA